MSTVVRITLLAILAAIFSVLAGCGGGDWEECPEPTPTADGKKGVPTEPCGDNTF